MKKVYLDNAATTMTAKEVVEAMTPYFIGKFGNASCLHQWGQEAREAIESARAVIAKRINAQPDEIIFTSGGSESNNLAIKGIIFASMDKGNQIITSKFEHPAVLNLCKTLEKDGFKVTYLDVSKDGFINLDKLKSSITEKTIIVSIMHANNEIGSIQDIEAIAKICKEKDIVFHTDAVQSFTKVPFDVKKINCDLASFSAHKLHGPKGVGALYIRKGTKLKKLVDGGPQEFNLRSGTENVSGIVGFSKAVELMNDEDIEKMQELRDYLINSILSQIKDTSLNASRDNRLCNNVSISFKDVEGESILLALDDKGIAVTTSSACTSQTLEPSHVLKAIGLRSEDSHGTIRFSLSRYTTKDEIDYTLKELKEIIDKLRSISPGK